MKIETHDLVKTYGERTVVNHVNVTVEQGKIGHLGIWEPERPIDILIWIVGIIH